MRIDKNTTIRLGDRNIVKIKIGDSVIWQKDNTDYLYIQNTYAGSNTITFTTTQSGTPASGTYATSVECSKDKLTWNTLNLTPGVTNTITLNQGEKLYLRNDSGYFNYTDDSNNYYTTITGSKSHKLGGNINTLINYTDLSNVSLSQGCFFGMFHSDIELVDASDLKLPSTTLVPHCYRALLNDCQSLLYAPALPATTLASKCYYAMFYGDYSLISAPELPATNLANACYESIFRSCTSLTSVTIYATSTANNAFEGWLNNVAASGTVYNNGGISLPKNSPSGIPSGWTVVEPDYFYVENTYGGGNTISVKQTITGSPDSSLYSKTLQYSKDKTNWSTITLSSTAYTITLNQGERVYFRGNEGVLNYYAKDGAIQAITNILGTQTHTIGGNINTLVNYITPNNLTLPQGVFAGLFQNNTTITSAETLTLPPSSDGSLSIFAYCLMFSGCSALITAPSEIPATKQGHASCGKMFLDCIQLKTPPALPATILANYCYTDTFHGCTSLVNPPELPATTLVNSCYRRIFQGCSSLNSITVYADDISATNCTFNWLSGVASSGTFNNYGSATYTANSPSGIPTGWTEVKN